MTSVYRGGKKSIKWSVARCNIRMMGFSICIPPHSFCCGTETHGPLQLGGRSPQNHRKDMLRDYLVRLLGAPAAAASVQAFR